MGWLRRLLGLCSCGGQVLREGSVAFSVSTFVAMVSMEYVHLVTNVIY